MRKYFLMIAIFCLAQVTGAHPGGHGADNHHSGRNWYLKDQSQAAFGAFLLDRNNKVFVEQPDGSTVLLNIDDLSETDQKYVAYKQRMIAALNGQVLQQKVDSRRAKAILKSALPYSWWLFALGLGVFSWMRRKQRRQKTTMGLALLSGMVLFVVACNQDNGDTDPVTNLSGTEVMESAFEPYKQLVTTRWDDTYFYVESQGIPDHQMMVGITAWIAQVPIPYSFTGDDAWAIPLNPQFSDEEVSIENNLRRGAIGIAANGIPIFNPINASGLVSKEIGELDEFGGHSGRGDDYHYHTAPLHLETTSGSNPIAYALDGYPVYGSTEPDGAEMQDLDEYHGHEYKGGYHYHGTQNYPYMVEKMRGKVTLSGTAPETQIEPQPVAQAMRKEIHPINSDNLVITDLLEKEGSNGYVLTYEIDGVEGSVDYSWNDNGLYTFIFHDVDGTTTTETYQR